MKANEVARELAGNIESVAKYLFPLGVIEGHEYCVGNITGTEGKSLKICMQGQKAGIWADFAEGSSGDLLDLWAKVKGVSVKEAMNDAASFMGLREPERVVHKEKPAQPPVVPNTLASLKKAPEVQRYLTVDRGLSPQTLETYKIRGDKNNIYFPFMWEGKARMLKSLALKRVDGKKDCRVTSAGQFKGLMGWNTINPSSRSVVICEGEINAMSVHQMGHDAMAVPFGAGKGAKQDWISNEYDNLDRFDTIYLWFDNDAPGKDAIEEILPRLGAERVRVINADTDANDCLLAGVGLQALLDKSTEFSPGSLSRMEKYREDVFGELSNPLAYTVGYKLPFSQVGTSFVFRQGEVTLLSGLNSSGKTAGVGQMVVNVMMQGGGVCIASMEGQPKKWAANMLRQYCFMSEIPVPSAKPDFDLIWDWFHQLMFTYDNPGRGVCKDILEVFKHTRRRYGVGFFIVDNLTAVDVALDDYEGQRNFMQNLVNFAKTQDAHVLCVAHQRKPGIGEASNRYSIKGSGALSDLADNVIIWERNKAKEKAERDRDGSYDFNKPDALMSVDKQRETGVEPDFGLYFDYDSKTFRS